MPLRLRRRAAHAATQLSHRSVRPVTFVLRKQGKRSMLLDHRTYTVRAGTLRKQMALYEKHGLASQKRHFGEPLAWLVSETGDVNTYVHIWVYEDVADRAKRREALFKDPEWLKYIEMNAEAGYLIKQESKLMSPASFAPIKR
jgi:hypothetical protein